jgi:serine/threonine protein kinase
VSCLLFSGISNSFIPFHFPIISPLDVWVSLVHLERLGSMEEKAVRVYVAEIASALTFLHDKRIIHRCETFFLRFLSHLPITVSSIPRDLKPDNILLDERGHAHITDLNIAVHYSERRMLTGVAGSMAYMGKFESCLHPLFGVDAHFEVL